MHGQVLNRREGIELYRIRKEAKLTDLLFVCCKNGQQRHIPANKVIFSTISPFLKRLFDTTNEKQPYEKVMIMIDSVDFAIMEKLIEYAYEGETIVNNQQRQELAELCHLLQLEINVGLDAVVMDRQVLSPCENEILEDALRIANDELSYPLKNEPSTQGYNASSNDHPEIPESPTFTHLQSLEDVSQSKDSENTASAELSYDTPRIQIESNIPDKNVTDLRPAAGEEPAIDKIDAKKKKAMFKQCSFEKTNTEEVPSKNDLNLEEEMITDQTFKSAVKATGVKDVNTCTKSAIRKSGRPRNSRRRLKLNTEIFHKKVQGTISKQFSCKDCNYVTSYISKMNRHTKVHLKIKNFICDQCDFSARDQYDLRQHRNGIHLNIKSYKCKDCSYCSSYKRNLMTHIKGMHLRINDFQCMICKYSTSQKSHLNRHVKNVHRSSSLSHS